MFNHLYPIEIDCDAPPYPFVQACLMIGLQSPEDVRWCRLRHLHQLPNQRLELFKIQTWKSLLGMSEPNHSTCTCRAPLPKLERYTFTCLSGREVDYFIGQCAKCRAIFWEEA